jgi:hypothetical protein
VKVLNKYLAKKKALKSLLFLIFPLLGFRMFWGELGSILALATSLVFAFFTRIIKSNGDTFKHWYVLGVAGLLWRTGENGKSQGASAASLFTPLLFPSTKRTVRGFYLYVGYQIT